MISWRARHRLFTVLSIVAVIAGVFFAGYALFRAEPSCSDNLKNQNELGVDCGGGCERVCREEVSEMQIFWANSYKVSSGHYDVATLVENPNQAFGVRKLNYHFKLYDKDGLLISEHPGSTFINPRERFVIFSGNIDTGLREVERVVFTYDDPLWERIVSSRDRSRIVVESKLYEAGPPARFSARLISKAPSLLREVNAVAVLSSADGRAVAVSSTRLPSLDRSESRAVVFTWPELLSSEPELFEIYVRVNEFENISK